MSFTFDASKAQQASNTTLPAQGTPGFTAGTSGAGDAGKSLSTGFSMPSLQTTPKPGGLFGSSLAGTPAPTFGSPAAPSSALNLGTTTSGTPGTGLTFGAAAPAPAAGMNFGLGGGTTAPTGFGSSSFTSSVLGAATATTTAGGLSFGAPKPAAPATGFSLGSTTSAAASAAPKLTFGATMTPHTGFSLSGVSAAPPLTATPASTSTGFGLGATTATTQQTGALGAVAPTSGFSITPSTGAQSLNTAFGIGQTTVTTAATTASTGFSLTGTTTAASTGFNLGSSAAPTITTGFALNKTTTTQPPTSIVTTNAAPQTTLGTVTTVSSSSSGQLGTMNFCQLEESINKWTLELEEQEKAFVNQATQVNAWDKMLIANGEKIATLNQEVERVKLEQQQLDHELDYVVGQQKELQDCLVPLEKELASLSVADPEREYTYRLAENLDKQLKQMSQDLKEIIEHLNEANRSQDPSDPIVQIGKILNAHMNSLQWLDQRTSVLAQKIQQIDQMHQNFRQENERSFNLAYN